MSRAHNDGLPGVELSVVKDHIQCGAEPLLLLDLQNGSHSRAGGGQLQVVFEKPLGQAHQHQKKVGNTLSGDGADGHNSDGPGEVRDAVISVGIKSVLVELAHQLIDPGIQHLGHPLALGLEAPGERRIALGLPAADAIHLIGGDHKRCLEALENG